MEETKVPVYDEEKPPTEAELVAKAIRYLRQNKPQEYKSLKEEGGGVYQYALAKAQAAERYAANLITEGKSPTEAWNMAIRQEILESESD